MVRMAAIFIGRSSILEYREEVALDLHRWGEIAAGDGVAGRARSRVGEHLDPVLVEHRPQRAIGDPHRHLDDVVRRASRGADDAAHILKHLPTLLLEAAPAP